MRTYFVPLVVLGALIAGCGATEVHSVEDARSAIREIVEGKKKPSDFKLAGDATVGARAILGDKNQVGSLKTELELNPEKVCKAAEIAADLGHEDEDRISITDATRQQIKSQVNASGIDVPEVDVALNAVDGLTKSAVTEAVAQVCKAGEQF